MFNFKLYKAKSIKDYIKQRETQEGLKNVFFTKIDKHKTRDKILEDLIKQLEIKGFKIVNKKRRKNGN